MNLLIDNLDNYRFTDLQKECDLHRLKYRKSTKQMIKVLRNHYCSSAHGLPALEIDDTHIAVKTEDM